MSAPSIIASCWNEAAYPDFSEKKLLLSQSNLPGPDLRITNCGDGNTSARIAMSDVGIWEGSRENHPAAAYKIDEAGAEEHYCRRRLLKKNIFPEDVAEGVYFFAGPASPKSTGNILNIDAGNAVSFTR